MNWTRVGCRRLVGVPVVAGLMASIALTYQIASAHEPGLRDFDGPERDNEPSVYYVTLINQTHGQGFSFPVAATHAAGFHMFQVGGFASVQAANIAQIGTPVSMYNLLLSNPGGAVTDVYVHAFPVTSAGAGTSPWRQGLPYFDGGAVPGLYPTPTDHTLTSTISFTLTATRGDRFSLLMMMMCTNDGLAGLDSVKLPWGIGHTVEYDVFAYDAGVEMNTEQSADIVDPCGLMAPYGANGQPQVSTTDGNRNSPPSPSQPPPGTASDPAIQTSAPIALYSNPTIVGIGNIPVDFGWDATRPVGKVTITRIK